MFKFVKKSDDSKIATRDAVRAHLKKLYGKKQTPDQGVYCLLGQSMYRRVMPEPEIMLRDVLDVYTAFLNLDDPDTKSDRFPFGEPFYKQNMKIIFACSSNTFAKAIYTVDRAVSYSRV